MFSCENTCTKVYSNDLHCRMVHHRCLHGLSYKDIAERLSVDPSTVCRSVKLFEETGTVCSIQGYHENTTKKLNAQDEIYIIEALLDNSSSYLHELQNMVSLSNGTSISTATICKFLVNQDFSRKKLTFRAQQRKKDLRSLFLSDISILEPHVHICGRIWLRQTQCHS